MLIFRFFILKRPVRRCWRNFFLSILVYPAAVYSIIYFTRHGADFDPARYVLGFAILPIISSYIGYNLITIQKKERPGEPEERPGEPEEQNKEK